MVKTDVKHNYYADLELPTTATIDDIRKAYRKLALQYHPDRNSGREDECVPKFQAIQAANEVLGDVASKQKYDTDRRKAGLFPTGTTYNPRQPAPGNPYAANSAYPPPPRRSQPGPYQRAPPPTPGAGPGAVPTGADRFTNFPRQPPTARKTNAQHHASAWSTWGKAQQNAANQPKFNQNGPTPQAPPQPQAYPGPRPQPPPRQPEPKMPPPQQPRPGMKPRNVPPPFDPETVDSNATQWSKFRQNNATKPPMPGAAPGAARTPKKPGFDPNLPGSDEKPAGSQYTASRKSTDFGRGKPNLNVPPPRAGPPPPGMNPTTPVSPISPTSQRPGADPTRPYGSRTPNDQVPFAEGNRQRKPYASFVQEKTHLGDGLRRSYSTRDTTTLGPEEAANRGRARSVSPTRRQRASDGEAQASKQKPFVVYSSSEGSGSESDVNASTGRPGTAPNPTQPFDRPKKTPTPPSRRFNGGTSGPTSPPPPMPNGAADGMYSDNDQPAMQQRATSNIFAFPRDIGLDTPSNTNAKSRSEENINTTFSPEGWSGAFTGEPDYFAPPTGSSKKQTSPTRRNTRSNRTPGEQARSATMDVPNTNVPLEEVPSRPWGSDGRPKDTPLQTEPGEVRFSQDEWAKTFKDGSWAYQPEATSGSPSKTSATPAARKQSQARKASKAAPRGTKHPQPAHVVDEDDTVEVEGADGRPESGAPLLDDDAMDIDNTPPAQQNTTAQANTAPTTQGQEKEARLYSVPPSEWRQEQAQRHHQLNGNRKSSTATNRPRQQSVNEGTKLNTNLDDLRNVEPMAKSAGGGLEGLGDMGSSLPFQSQASASLPGKILVPQQLEMPKVPNPPVEPTKLTKTSWQGHVNAFGDYLVAFHNFNEVMIRHFQAREYQARGRFINGTSWLEATGDTTAQTGFGSYLNQAKEDEPVRETWNVGCEKHVEALKSFERIRERVRKLALGGMLSEN